MTLHALMRGPLALSARQTKNAKAQGAVTVDAAPFFSNQPVKEGMVVRIALDGLVQDFGRNAEQHRQIPVEQHLHAAERQDARLDRVVRLADDDLVSGGVRVQC